MNILEKSVKLNQKTQCQHGIWNFIFNAFPFADDAKPRDHPTQTMKICKSFLFKEEIS